ncbi:MAG: replicative DNA helicase [Acholeplasmatales bacterium]|jgi:replicative DNA helicase|nr:replicative DNA helicase [Acholeplasmatales bacterium]
MAEKEKIRNKVIPYDEEAEIGVLGCCFVDEGIVAQLMDTLKSDDFYSNKNRIIYEAIRRLFEKGDSVDITTVRGEIAQLGLKTQSGGDEYITYIAQREYTIVNFETYAERVKNQALRRSAINTLDSLSQYGFDQSLTTSDFIEKIEKDIFDLSTQRNQQSLTSIRSVVDEVNKNITENVGRSNIVGLKTGFPTLDNKTLGLQDGALLILAARPGVGKSAFALNLARNVCELNKNAKASVALFSLEMPATQLVERLLAASSGVSLSDLKVGNFDSTYSTAYNNSCEELKNLNLYFDDTSNITVSAIRAKCRKHKLEHGLDLVVIDYLQLIDSEKGSERLSTQEKVSRITRSLKLMARELSIPVVALSQLSRELEKREDKRPLLSDLRDSGSIEQDADIVMFLYSDELYNKQTKLKGIIELLVAKNRSGSPATNPGIMLSFNRPNQKFTETKMNEEPTSDIEM